MKHVLVVDDDEFVRVSLKEILERAGHSTELAVNGDDAMDKIDRRKPDVIFLDIVMPEKEGMETLLELKRVSPEIKIIMISGGGSFHDTNDYYMAAELFGADAVLKKPLRGSTVLEALETILSKEDSFPMG